MKPATPSAYKLMHDGALALAEVEENGMMVDVNYLNREIRKVGRKIEKLETQLKEDKIWKRWKRMHSSSANLSSRFQLGKVLSAEGLVEKKATRGGRIATDAGVLEKIDHPFIHSYIEVEKLKKLKGTYLEGILKESDSSWIVHPFYNLHLARSFRSSADSPNLQNLPIRDPEIGKRLRSAFIPRDKNRCLVEIDYSGIEVRVAACYNKDPVLIRYIEDPSTDMHRDMASEIYFLKPDMVTKGLRYCAKNKFVFPEFYGSYYKQCAPELWNGPVQIKGDMIGEVHVFDHLKANGIKSLGSCIPDEKPVPGTFEYHIQKVEEDFWKKRFKVYHEWKREWYADYLKNHGCRLLTGFVADSLLDRKVVINTPIQGSAFHCLLLALIIATKRIRKRKMDAKVCCQIHDSIVADVHEDYVDSYIRMVSKIMTEEIPDQWPWLIVPLAVEVEVSPPGKSWYEKKVYEYGV